MDRIQGRDRSRDGDARDACQNTRKQAFREELPEATAVVAFSYTKMPERAFID